mgnify:CR=1 FL=1
MSEKNFTATSYEGYMLKNAPKGQSFFTIKSDKSMTAFAKYHERKIKTERIVAISGIKKEPTAFALTKVTIL